MGDLSVKHILISEKEEIVYLCCADRDGNNELFCIKNYRLVKKFDGSRWNVTSQLIAEQVIDLVKINICRQPTFRVKNIESKFVN